MLHRKLPSGESSRMLISLMKYLPKVPDDAYVKVETTKIEILTVDFSPSISICCSCFIRFIFALLTLKQKTRVVKPFG